MAEIDPIHAMLRDSLIVPDVVDELIMAAWFAGEPALEIRRRLNIKRGDFHSRVDLLGLRAREEGAIACREVPVQPAPQMLETV